MELGIFKFYIIPTKSKGKLSNVNFKTLHKRETNQIIEKGKIQELPINTWEMTSQIPDDQGFSAISVVMNEDQ